MPLLPMVIPAGWEHCPSLQIGPLFAEVAMRHDGLKILASRDVDGDVHWLHISVSHPRRYPTWEELRFVKDTFIGKDKEAVQIFPREQDYVNVHKNCFHLWHCLTGDTVPGNPQR